MISHSTPGDKFAFITSPIGIVVPIAIVNYVAPDAIMTPDTTLGSVLHMVALFVYIIVIVAINVFLGYFVYERIHNSFVARRLITSDIYEIMEISDTEKPESSGAFGRWKSIHVTLKNTNTGETKDIKCYPETLQGRSIGERVGIVVRLATHTYEMDKYYLIPEQEFNLENERKKYRDGIPVYDDEREPETGWTAHAKNIVKVKE